MNELHKETGWYISEDYRGPLFVLTTYSYNGIWEQEETQRYFESREGAVRFFRVFAESYDRKGAPHVRVALTHGPHPSEQHTIVARWTSDQGYYGEQYYKASGPDIPA